MLYLISQQLNAFNNVFSSISEIEAINNLSKLSEIGIDTETTGLDCYLNNLLTIQLGNKENQYIFDLTSYENKIPKLLNSFLNTSKSLFILQGAKFDIKFLFTQDIKLKNVWDTYLAEIIITNSDDHPKRSLDALCMKYCGIYMDKSIREEIITKGITNKGIEYGAKDVEHLIEIKHKQSLIAKEFDLLTAIKLDCEFVHVLAYIEYCGIKLDWEKWKEKSKSELLLLEEAQKKLNNWLIKNNYDKYFYIDQQIDLFSGASNEPICTLNWNSQKQVIPIFESLGIDCTVIEKGEKKKSIKADIIAPQQDKSDLIPLYINYKELGKLCSTYGLNWESFINNKTGRIHTSFKQLMNTGRLSCGEKRRDGTKLPNLQNLPSDKFTRSCFVADSGNKLCAADYSAQEQRVLANFSKESNLLAFYSKGLSDMHSFVAFLMYPEIRECSIEDITNDVLERIKKNHKDKRSLAKNAGFAINYGGNGVTIAKNTGLTQSQGEFVYNSYFEGFPDLKEYFAFKLKETLKNDYILFNNVTKRKFFLNKESCLIQYKELMKEPSFNYANEFYKIRKQIDKETVEIAKKSQNYPIQGSSADITKLACIYFYRQILKNNWWQIVKIVNIVHDEIIIEAPEELIQQAEELLLRCMELAGDQFCDVLPLTAEPATGDYWIH